MHATLSPQKRFPMYIDHIHILTRRIGWKVTKVHLYYTFEQEPFKKEYILSTQRARQEAVARDDDVHASFWKLLINANLGFDCRANFRNKSPLVIYDENPKVEFLNIYSKYDSSNCFLDLDTRVKNIEEHHSNLDHLEDGEESYTETLKQKEINRVMDSYGRKKKGKKSKLLSHVEDLEEAYSNKACTFVQDLKEDRVNSVKGVACKKQTVIRVSTTYISSKLLTNADISLYDCIDTFCFLNKETPLIYARHKIIKELPYLLMTDTDLGSLQRVYMTVVKEKWAISFSEYSKTRTYNIGWIHSFQ